MTSRIFDGTGTTLGTARGIAMDVIGTLPTAPSPYPSEPTDAATPPRRTSKSRGAGRWITCDERAGVIEIRDPRMFRRGQKAFCRAVVEAAVTCCGAVQAGVSVEKATCRLEFVPGRLDRTDMARRVTTAIRMATPTIRERRPSPSVGSGPGDAADAGGRRRRLKHAAMAGGSLAAAAGAVILPGLPTLPFLILTGRHAAMASHRVERLLRSHPWTARMLDEAEASGGPAVDWRSMLGMIAVAACFAAGIYLFQPPLPIVLLLEVGLMLFMGLFDRLKSALPELGGVLALA